MKTRIIQTRFWDDLFVSESDIYTQHLYIYLLTSQYINLCGIFQLPESKIKFEAKFTDNQFESAKENLQKAGKVFFYKGWVCVKNARKNNNYESSPKNATALVKELNLVPEEIAKAFSDTTIDSTIDSTMHSTYKSEIINHKSGIRNQESENDYELMTRELLDYWNETKPTKLISINPYKANLAYWLEGGYTLEDIKRAVDNIEIGLSWADTPSLELLLRQKDKSGSVDRIAACLNATKKKDKFSAEWGELLKQAEEREKNE